MAVCAYLLYDIDIDKNRNDAAEPDHLEREWTVISAVCVIISHAVLTPTPYPGFKLPPVSTKLQHLLRIGGFCLCFHTVTRHIASAFHGAGRSVFTARHRSMPYSTACGPKPPRSVLRQLRSMES